jgi:peptidoglycan/xylan/chitin deacetylase (PgdA/CDA1 family)
MKNCLSIDVESWAYGDTPEFRSMTSLQRKQADNGYLLYSMRKVLGWLRESNVKLTLFMIGEQFDWYPELVEEILSDGHELGLHAYRHYRIDDSATLRQDLECAMPAIQKYGVKGYRAPLIHLPQGGFDILKSFGFVFDSSIYGPYSMCGSYRGIQEVPITSLVLKEADIPMQLPRHLSFGNILKKGEFPLGASYFVGLLGNAITPFIHHLNRHGKPGVFFLHNWQLVPRPAGAFPPPSYVWKHPLYWPLTRNLEKPFLSWLQTLEFDKMSTFCSTKEQPC